jgi:hypothetical protein
LLTASFNKPPIKECINKQIFLVKKLRNKVERKVERNEEIRGGVRKNGSEKKFDQ